MITAQVTGLSEILLKLQEAPKRLANKALRPAVTKAARRIRAAMREQVQSAGAVDSGALKRSIAQKVYTYKGRMGVGAVVGPSRKFVAQVSQNKRGKMRMLTKKKLSAGQRGQKRKPSKYAHLIERGHATRGRRGQVAGRPFAGTTLRQTSQETQSLIADELRGKLGEVFGNG